MSPTSMLSLTAQWIDTDFKLQKIVLHSEEFRGSHTAVAISEASPTCLTLGVSTDLKCMR